MIMGAPQLAPSTSAAQRARSVDRWHNTLPDWILEHPEYARLGRGPWITLQAIANACDREPDGSLTHAFGSACLAARARCSVRTFWRELRQLEALGFVVLVSRGGTYLNRESWPNVYSIPASPAGLDDQRVRHETRRMIAGEDGKYRPEIVEPGEQCTLWGRAGPPRAYTRVASSAPEGRSEGDEATHTPRANVTHTPCQPDTHPVSDCHTPRVSLTHTHTHANHPNHTLCKNHGDSLVSCAGGGGGGHGRPGRRGPRMPAMTTSDLRSVGRLLELFRTAVDRGLIDGSDDSRTWFVAAAYHAIRIATRNPPGLFARLICTHQRSRTFVTPTELEVATVQIREHLDRQSAGSPEELPSQSRQSAPPNSMLVEIARAIAAKVGLSTEDAHERIRRCQSVTDIDSAWIDAVRILYTAAQDMGEQVSFAETQRWFSSARRTDGELRDLVAVLHASQLGD